MKNNILKPVFFALALLCHAVLPAQHVVTGCETVTGAQSFWQPAFTVTATGNFINYGTVTFSGVTTLTNDGGMSDRVVNDCTADYASPCIPDRSYRNSQTVGSANIFDNTVAATTIEYGSAPRSSRTFTNWATVERFWPMAT